MKFEKIISKFACSLIIISILLLGSTIYAKDIKNMHILPFEPIAPDPGIDNNGAVIPGCSCFVESISPDVIEFEYFGNEQIFKNNNGEWLFPKGITIELYASTVPYQFGVFWSVPQESRNVRIMGTIFDNPLTLELIDEGQVTIKAYCVLNHSEGSFNSFSFEII